MKAASQLDVAIECLATKVICRVNISKESCLLEVAHSTEYWYASVPSSLIVGQAIFFPRHGIRDGPPGTRGPRGYLPLLVRASGVFDRYYLDNNAIASG